MYKTLSANMVKRQNRSNTGGMKRVHVTAGGKRKWGPKPIARGKSRKDKERTGPELVPMLGSGLRFVQLVYRRYRRQFCAINHEPKQSSAYLNIVAGKRMLDGSLWTDNAVISMFRRMQSKA